MPERLRIAQVAPIATSVTPDSTQSIEQLVRLLTEELVHRGHDVTLFATGDSQTSATLCAGYSRGYEDDDELWNWQFHETLHVASAFERADEFDVIHSHVYHDALPFIRLVETPVVHTYHITPDRDIVRGFARYPEAHVVAISDFQRRTFGRVADTVVHHGIDIGAFPFREARGDYLFFLGRLLPEKGPLEAILLARRAAMPLVIAGPKGDDKEYFRTEISPRIDGREVTYVGPVGVAERNSLLAGAAALIYPIVEPEPFGLVLVEAIACGTPVVARAIGAVPEIVEDGVTGFGVTDPEAMAARIPDAVALDRARVRREAVARFDYRRMVDDYEKVYRRLAEGRRGQGR